MKNIKQYATQLEVNIERIYKDNPSNAQKEVQSLLNEYANRQEIEEIRFIDKDQIIMATAKLSSHSLINQKVNDNSVQKQSLGEANSHNVLKDYGHGKERIWIYNLPVKNGNDVIGNIYIESNINDVYNQLNNINQIFIIGTAISLFITVILGFFIARTITRPITDMRNQTVEMSKGTIHSVLRFMAMTKLVNLRLRLIIFLNVYKKPKRIQKVKNVDSILSSHI